MLNKIDLLARAIGRAPRWFVQNNWEGNNGGRCVVAWLCHFFHRTTGLAQNHTSDGDAIEICVMAAYGISLQRVKALVVLNDDVYSSRRQQRKIVIDSLRGELEYARFKQSWRLESERAEQLEMVPAAIATTLPVIVAVDVIEQASSVAAEAFEGTSSSLQQKEHELVAVT